jgi:hypothetical protein
VAVEDDAIAQAPLQRLPEAVAHGAHADHRLQILRQRAGGAKADREQGAFGTGAPAMLMSCAVDQRLEHNPMADIERTHTLRRVELVAGDREEIDAKRVDVGWNLAD